MITRNTPHHAQSRKPLSFRLSALTALLLILACDTLATDANRWEQTVADRKAYRESLDNTRQAFGGAYKLPPVDFFLFGMGPRDKFVYTAGKLSSATTGKIIRQWEVAQEIISPAAYTVAIKTTDGKFVFLWEDEESFWLQDETGKQALSKGAVKLPDFKGKKHRLVLRVLHQELLVNVLDGKPLPNFFVYDKPWYRDGAMTAMAFEKTANLPVLKDWILSLRDPFDKNNKGETEADNLGQGLYLVSLVSDKSHPLVPAILKEFPRFNKQQYIEGRTDFASRPVYQTKWAKFGLRSLGLDDPYVVPKVKDAYAALFWWDYKNDDLPNQQLLSDDPYPYLGWASSHYAGRKTAKLSDRDYPLTWEAHASGANYEGMKRISPEFQKAKTCAPHTWHAAEAFLYLLEEAE